MWKLNVYMKWKLTFWCKLDELGFVILSLDSDHVFAATLFHVNDAIASTTYLIGLHSRSDAHDVNIASETMKWQSRIGVIGLGLYALAVGVVVGYGPVVCVEWTDVTSGKIGMRRCLECLECGCKVWYVQMSPDVVLECRECGRGLADSCITTGKPLYHYCHRTDLSLVLSVTF